MGADPLLETNVVMGTNAGIEAPVLNGDATLEWTNVISWNSNPATGNAGDNFFAAVEDLSPRPLPSRRLVLQTRLWLKLLVRGNATPCSRTTELQATPESTFPEHLLGL